MDYGKTFINYGILTIVLQGDAESLHKRCLNRIYNENRHPVHLILYQTDSNILRSIDEFMED